MRCEARCAVMSVMTGTSAVHVRVCSLDDLPDFSCFFIRVTGVWVASEFVTLVD